MIRELRRPPLVSMAVRARAKPCRFPHKRPPIENRGQWFPSARLEGPPFLSLFLFSDTISDDEQQRLFARTGARTQMSGCHHGAGVVDDGYDTLC
jgi:hypothetical protein